MLENKTFRPYGTFMVCVVIRLKFNGFSSVNILAHLIGLVKREKNRFKMEDEHILLKKSKKNCLQI